MGRLGRINTMLELLKDLFGFNSEGRRNRKPLTPWPEEMMKSRLVAKPINPPPPCPPVAESEIFKKAKDIIQLEGFVFFDNPYAFLGGGCSRYDLGDIRLITHAGYGKEKDYLKIALQGAEIPLAEQESVELAKIWDTKRKKELKQAKEEWEEEIKDKFLKLNLNDITGNKTTD